MIQHLREVLRRKPLVGVAFSVAIHAALLFALIGVHPARTPEQKRGDALIVELPTLDEPGGRGTPGPQADAPPVPAPRAPAPPAQPAPPARQARPARPTPPTPPAPPRPALPVRPAPKPEPPAVASAPPPPPVERGELPSPKPVAQPAPEPTRVDPPRVETPSPAPPAPEPPAVASAPPTPPGPVAMVPPSPPDIRSALRRGGGGGGTGLGGAGGTGGGRAGIEGEPVALDSKDPNFHDYLERVRALIKRHWSYPCVKNVETRECEYKSGQLVIAFGILKNGQLGFVELQRSTGHLIMDDYAANAIKLASPFPAIPPAMLQNRKGAGLPIVARFNYVLETGLTNVLR